MLRHIINALFTLSFFSAGAALFAPATQALGYTLAGMALFAASLYLAHLRNAWRLYRYSQKASV
jgi:hypothetical protein